MGFVPWGRGPSDGEVRNEFERFASRIRKLAKGGGGVWKGGHPLLGSKKIKGSGPCNIPDIEEYITLTRDRLERHMGDSTRSVYTNGEMQTLIALGKDTSLTIKPADKDQIIVVQDTTDYITACMVHLNDADTYEQLNGDYTKALAQHIHEFIDHLTERGVIDKITSNFLRPCAKVRSQAFYTLPKTHKKVTPIPTRPIVSGCSGPNENISRFISYILNPIVKRVKSYVKDSKHLVNIIESTTIQPSSLLVTMDVGSLYTNIPQDEGVEVALSYMEKYKEEVPFWLPPSVVREMFKYVLKHNIFNFNGKSYRQKYGTAMGTSMAPPFAILYMAHLEEEFWLNEQLKPDIYLRYIDDILLTWPHGQENLDRAFERLNRQKDRIQYTITTSDSEVNFLDVTLYKGDRFKNSGILDIRPYFKQTNQMNYLHYSSSHPPSVFKGIVVGECTRFIRNSSDQVTYTQTIQKLKEALKLRGYPPHLLDKWVQTRLFENRKLLLEDKVHDRVRRPVMVQQFSGKTKPIGWILNQSWGVVTNLPDLADKFDGGPLSSYTVAKSVSKMVVRAKLKCVPNPPDIGLNESHICFPTNNTICNHPQCECCKLIKNVSHIHSTASHQTYPIEGTYTCKSMEVIYIITCSQCGIQYVGETGTTVGRRMRAHRNKLEGGDNKPIYRHYRKKSHNFHEASLTIVQQVANFHERRRCETLWIKRMKSLLPLGLNYYL